MSSRVSPIIRSGVRAASPLAVLVGVYLLFAGHNNPGGGFAAGLVFGAVFSLRTLSGIQRPVNPTLLVSVGIGIIIVVAALPILWDDPLLDQKIFSEKLPLLGKVKSGSALPFDIGVTAVVIGLIAALIDGLGTKELAGREGVEGAPPAPEEGDAR